VTLVDEQGSEQVLVQVFQVESGEEISWQEHLAERLQERLADIRAAIVAGSETISQSLTSLASAEGWQLGEVSASFGITLTAEAGVILSKAAAGATFEVTITFTRNA
jgi:hypothetical protein